MWEKMTANIIAETFKPGCLKCAIEKLMCKEKRQKEVQK